MARTRSQSSRRALETRLSLLGDRVTCKLIGTDVEPKRVPTVDGRAYTFTGLTSGKTVKVSIAGCKDAGEDPMSAQLEAVVP